MKSLSMQFVWLNIRSFLEAVPRYLFISWLGFIKIAVLLIGFLVAAWVVAVALFTEPSQELLSVSRLPSLKTDDIDSLELWLEQNETQHSALLQITPTVFYTPPPVINP